MKPQQNKKPDERQLTGNSSGKYNMNFIDETNDLAAYCNGDLSPELQDLIVKKFTQKQNSYFQTITWSEQINQKNHFQPVINMCESQIFNKNVLNNKKKSEKEKQRTSLWDHCSVCTQNFIENQQVKVLPCGHLFHKQCIKPWFEVNSNCPNCRFDLYQGKINEN